MLTLPISVTFAEGEYNDSDASDVTSTEEREFEYPLCDCICCEVYWTTFVAKVVQNLFGIKLKHRSKKVRFLETDEFKLHVLSRLMVNFALSIQMKD